MGKMERNCKRNSIDYSIRIICYMVSIYGGCEMKLSDYNKIMNKMKILGYPVEEMTAEDTWLMLRAFS